MLLQVLTKPDRLLTQLPGWSSQTHSCAQVRDVLISKKQRLIRSLKEALSRVPRRIVAAVAAKFSELDKRLRIKASSIEEVADQRQFMDALPRRVAELVAEMEAAQVAEPKCSH